MLHVLTLKWQAVGPQVEVAEHSVPDICTVNPELFGQGHLRNEVDEDALAKFIADGPLMYRLLAQCVEQGRANRQIVELVDRHK